MSIHELANKIGSESVFADHTDIIEEALAEHRALSDKLDAMTAERDRALSRCLELEKSNESVRHENFRRSGELTAAQERANRAMKERSNCTAAALDLQAQLEAATSPVPGLAESGPYTLADVDRIESHREKSYLRLRQTVGRCLELERGIDDYLTKYQSALNTAAIDRAAMAEKSRVLEQLVDEATTREAVLTKALEFYANPETYHSITIISDSPAGGFADDVSEDHGHENYERRMPGKLARAALADCGATVPSTDPLAKAIEAALPYSLDGVKSDGGEP